MLPGDDKEREEKEKRFINKRISICVIITLVIFCGFAARLFVWQIVEGEEYSKLADNSTAYTVTTDATRGEILDCKGKGLAVNRTGYRVVLDKLYIDSDKLSETILSLIDLMKTRDEEWIDILPVELNKKGAFRFKKDSADEIKTLKSKDFLNLTNSDSAEKCVRMLTERYKIENVRNNTDLLNILSVRYNMERNWYSNTNPYIFANDISTDMVAIISENMQTVSGVEIQTYLTRSNPSGSLAPHILGALGVINQEEYEAKQKEGKDYGFNDYIGKFGLELSYEDELKGVGGERIVQKNADGNVIKEVRSVDAKPGHTLYLTLDSKLQSVAVKSLEAQVKAARAFGRQEAAYKGKGQGEDCKTGAVVMLDVKDFSVLAAASYPTYDLNKYSEYGKYYVKLATDKKAPLYNRAFVGSFAPGSTYKPCIAAAALEEGIIDPYTSITCTQKYDYYPTNPVNCMHMHGSINLRDAITKSCNYYFAEVGRRLGIGTAYLYAEKFSLGEKTGIEVSESKGFLAGRDSRSWQEGNTVQAAIGQSDNAFTPLQLATYTATIANNGKRLRTHLIKEIRNYERTKTIKKNDKKNPEVINTSGISQGNLDIVQSDMRSVCESESGTAYSIFGNYPIKVAAKTGTAENKGSDHSVFICFAPYDKPKVAIAVVLENGAHGKYSMTVAKDLMDEYFKLNTPRKSEKPTETTEPATEAENEDNNEEYNENYNEEYNEENYNDEE